MFASVEPCSQHLQSITLVDQRDAKWRDMALDLMNNDKITHYAYMFNDCVACVWGHVEVIPKHYTAWCFMGEPSRQCMFSIVKQARIDLDKLPRPNGVQIDVRAGFVAGHRFARLLGFEPVSYSADHYDDNGEDAIIYVRVR